MTYQEIIEFAKKVYNDKGLAIDVRDYGFELMDVARIALEEALENEAYARNAECAD